MNVVPQSAIKVSPDLLRQFTATVLQKAGVGAEQAAFMAELLVLNDLRGVFSHGSRQVATYARIIRDGLINPSPQVKVVSESPATLLVDGDGGLGYMPAHRLATALVDKCRACGIAAGVTRNHGHIGAAGLYSRILVEQNLIGYVTSGHQLHLSPDRSVLEAAGGSPMSFAIPAGKRPPLVLDFGAMHDLYTSSPHRDDIIRLTPGLVFRNLGLGAVCQALGGFLAGVPVEEERAVRQFKGANQGSLIVAIDPTRFLPLEQLQREMDRYHELASQMQPVPGFDRATLAGTLEYEREREWARTGVPVGDQHREILERVGAEFGVPLPF